MKTLVFTMIYDLSQLHDELLVAIPELASIKGEAVMGVEGKGSTVRLRVPNNVDETAIAAVVAAHIPRTILEKADLAKTHEIISNRVIVALIKAIAERIGTTPIELQDEIKALL